MATGLKPSREGGHQLVAWLREEINHACADCGAMFVGTRRRLYCDDCLRQHRKDADARYEEKRSIARKEARRKARLEKEAA